MEKIYKINSLFARANKLPIYFVGVELKRTSKAVYLYGKGTTETKKWSVCSICGRTLTHPVSVELGVGPECGQHYWDWDKVGGYTLENIKRLSLVIKSCINIDQWLPLSVIKETKDTSEKISVPIDHAYLQSKPTQVIRKASVFKYKDETYIKVEFTYNGEDLENVKTLPGRRFINSTTDKYWLVSYNLNTINKLKGWGFILDEDLNNSYSKFIDKPIMDKINISVIKGLKGTLYPFQKQGVEFIEKQQGKALIADEMGLGKTVQVLAWLQYHPEYRPVIIVVPASLKLNWAKEIRNWMTGTYVQVIDSTTNTIRTRNTILIINYDILDKWLNTLLSVKAEVLVMDECHYFKNNKAKRTKAVKTLAKNIGKVIALSGTPIVNRPVEIFNAINVIDPFLMPSYFAYVKKYCAAKKTKFGWDINGASNTQELHAILTNSIMIRRKKEDVLKDLPNKVRSYIPMEIDNGREYKAIERNFISYLKETKGDAAAAKASVAEYLTQIEALKQAAVKGKLLQVIEWIEDFIESGNKLVIFAVHKFVIDTLMEKFKDIAVKIDGSVTLTKRNDAVTAFQNDINTKVFIGNIKAAGTGLTLTAASDALFIELPWTPGDLIQAEDRLHRIGQKSSVNIHYALASGTIEMKIAYMLDDKIKVLDAVLDGKNTPEANLLQELIKSYTNEN